MRRLEAQKGVSNKAVQDRPKRIPSPKSKSERHEASWRSLRSFVLFIQQAHDVI